MRKCYEVEVEYLMKAVMKSKSPCLKINTVKGIITWKSEVKEVRLDFWKNGEECMEASFRSIRGLNPEEAMNKMWQQSMLSNRKLKHT